MASKRAPRRLQGLPRALVGGVGYPVATTLRSRLLGLALLDRDAASPGLLIPRCRSIHTFGMRFALDVVFLDSRWNPVSIRGPMPAGRLAFESRAAAVLERPAQLPETPPCSSCFFRSASSSTAGFPRGPGASDGSSLG